MEKEDHIIHLKVHFFLSYVDLVDLALDIELMAILLVSYFIEIVVREDAGSVVRVDACSEAHAGVSQTAVLVQERLTRGAAHGRIFSQVSIFEL